MAKFDWSQFPTEAAQPPVKGGKFDWNQFPVDGTSQESRDSAPGWLDGAVKSTVDALPMIGGVAGGILGTPLDAVSGPMGNVVGAGIGGYLGTATKNLINRYYDPQSAPQTTTQAITQPIVGGVEQGLMQGTGEAVTPLVTKGIQSAINAGSSAAKWAGTKLVSSLGGVKPDVINEYMQFADRINSSPAPEHLKEISDNFVGKLASDVDANKVTFDQAQNAYKGFASDLKDAYRTAGYDARDAATSAQQTLKDAHNARLQQLSGDIYDTINRLKTDVQGQSQHALETLNKSNAKVPLAPVYSEIDSSIAQLQRAGTDESLAAADKLQAYKDRLMKYNGTKQTGFQAAGNVETVAPATYEQNAETLRASGKLLPARFINGSNEDQWLKAGLLGKQVTPPVEVQPIGPKFGTVAEIGAPEAKNLIQGLDQVTEYSPLAGSFDKATNRAFKGIRSALDGSLKNTVDEYKQKMIPVAADAGLLDRISDFGDRQTAVNLLKNINAPNQVERRVALQELGNKYGIDFINAANPKNLPEQAIVNRAQAARESLRPDRVAEKLDQTLSNSRQKESLDTAQSGYETAQQKLAPFKSLAPSGSGQTQSQQKLMQLSKGKNIELEGMFRELGKLTDTDFVQAMKDHEVLAAFQKGATNGSRNTLMGALAGGMFGGTAGAAGGAAAGRVVDQWGPAITKKVLDGAILVSKNPSIATISKLNIPDPIKRNMVIGLENYFSKGQSASPLEQATLRVAQESGEPNRTPAVGVDRWTQQGVQKLGIQPDLAGRILQDPRGKQLLIQASDLTPGSKAMKRVMDQIQKGWGQK